MLALLGAGAIRLMTNNPAKVEALQGVGVTVAERVPMRCPPTRIMSAIWRPSGIGRGIC
jgi:GTP cyclohydrolase II